MTRFEGVPDMSGELGSLIVYIVFLIICFAFYKIAMLLKGYWFAVSAVIYLILIWFYFELVNQLHYYLRDNKILYIEFGHASLELILLMFFSFLNAFGFIVFVIYRRSKKRDVV
jgi:nitrate/nitrite transporter NarK